MTVTEPIFTKFRLVQQVFMQNSYTEFHYNPIQVLLDGGETWVSLRLSSETFFIRRRIQGDILEVCIGLRA